MKKINLLGYLCMALFLVFTSCTSENSILLDENSTIGSKSNSDCGECDGQITFLDLQYLGAESNATINVYEGKLESDKLFASFNGVNSGDSFSFVGSKKDNKMGAKILLTVNGGKAIEIHTSCSVDIYAGMTFGDFYINSGTSHGGGELCTTDTPPDDTVDCGECDGQITFLDLQYLGAESNATINVYEGKLESDKLFASFNGVNSGDSFSFVGSKKDNKMGAKILLTVNGGKAIEIHTSCSVDIYAGMTFGDFYINSGTSHGGGELCTTDTPPDDTVDCGECDGQITFLDLQYLGAESNATINVYEGKLESDKLFASFNGVNSGDSFSFVGSKKDNKMGAKILLTVNGGKAIEIHTSCSVDIFAGMTFGDFYINSGTSHGGGNLPDVNGNCEEEEECIEVTAKGSSRNNISYCFSGDGFTEWGWRNAIKYTVLESNQNNGNIYTLPLFVDEGGDICSYVDKIQIGHVELYGSFDGDTYSMSVKYVITDPNYTLLGASFYAGSEFYPRDSEGNFTVSENYFNYKVDNLDQSEYTFESYAFDRHRLTSQTYFIPYATVCKK